MGQESLRNPFLAISENSNLRLVDCTINTKNTHFLLKGGTFKNLNGFENWLKVNGKSNGYIIAVINILEKFFESDITTLEELKDKYANSELNKKYLYLGIRNFVKYCDEEDLMDDIVINKIKKFTRNPRRSNIDSFVPVKDIIDSLLEHIKGFNYLDYIAVQILIQSGMRVSEIVHFFNHFEESKVEIRENLVIYSLFHIRGQKNSYYIFMSKGIYDEFLINKDKFQGYNFERLKTHIKRGGLTPLKYMRKYNFTLMVQAGVQFDIANFIQGRCSTNIGFNHYLAKKEIAVKEYRKLYKSTNIYIKENLI